MGILSAFVPDQVADSVTEIDLSALSERGIEGLLVDVDNTLLAKGVPEVDSARGEWLRRATEQFAVCLLSNSVRGLRVAAISRQFSVDGISVWHWGRKPMAGGYRRALAKTGTAPERSAMIGDQLMTDIWGANRLGMYTVWVRRIDPSEFIFTRRVHRPLEAYIARRLVAAGLLPPMPEEDGQ